jgi:S1-C subfamily serine protease
MFTPNRELFRFSIGACLILLAVKSPSETLGTRLEQKVRDATFEVVLAIPEPDPLTYEKALPLELIPFALRNATHLPIGTAFCVGPNRYLSAAHVIIAGAGSQAGAPQLRDQSGQIYEIDQILRFSAQEDFAEFSLREPPRSQVLALNKNPEPNSGVFAVGNALGEGVIIRDGLFTSLTPEQLDGKWNWIRFSAAASPGNSGGPLLDQKGRVIGIVIGKSENENLNYALPIARATAAERNVARIDGRSAFSLPFAPESIVLNVSETVGLPVSYEDFANAVLEINKKSFDQGKAELMAAHGATFFPEGDGAVAMLNSHFPATEPRLILKKNDKWDAEKSDESESADLANGGSLLAGNIADIGLARIHLPDDVKIADLIADSKGFMDLFLKGVRVSRFVGSEAVRITSLGPAREETIFVDSYKRSWVFRTWYLPFIDAQLTSAALPVPDGFIVLSRTTPTGLSYYASELLKIATDLVHVAFSGTLGRWREYLALEAMLPAVFSDKTFDTGAPGRFIYRSPRIELSLGNDLLDITDSSVLDIYLAYFKEDRNVTWDITGLMLQEDAKANAWIQILRQSRPPASLGKTTSERWRDLQTRRRPFDSNPFRADDTAIIQSTVTRTAPNPETSIAPDAKIIYETRYGINPGAWPDEMRTLQNSLLDGLRILED